MNMQRCSKKGDVLQAWDESPRHHGQKRCLIELAANPYKHWLHEVTDENEEREEGIWGSGEVWKSLLCKNRPCQSGIYHGSRRELKNEQTNTVS